MKHPLRGELGREDLARWYRDGRARSAEIFAIPAPESYYERPIALRNPIVFYDGHLPAFCVNTLLKLSLRKKGVNEDYEKLFERGIDPESEAAVKNASDLWPKRPEVHAYGAAADAAIVHALREDDIERVDEATLAILEHEQMHQETLLYMFHNLPYEKKRTRTPLKQVERPATSPGEHSRISIPRGTATLGSDDRFGWDNEYPSHRVDVPAFTIDRQNVTNAQYLEFMTATGASAPHFWLQRNGEWFWRGMFEAIPLPLDWPVYATYDEAAAFARWRGGRVPSEPEYHRAAFGTPSGEERRFPWGDESPDHTRGNFDFANWDPVAVGSYPQGASAWGVDDLIGNGWEWTSTTFDGFRGFKPMKSYPVYSSDFFDGQHYVLKGGSPATSRDLIRRSFRNWFRPNYPYLYAKFRVAR
ncbi:MAG: SUMF1/EgtB/PvdO family nonheme iron enzyme [Thermoanaerobaculia bacterium]